MLISPLSMSESGCFAKVCLSICVHDCVLTSSVYLCVPAHPCMRVCVFCASRLIFSPFWACPTTATWEHKILPKCWSQCSPVVSKMHICDKSVALSASWPLDHFFSHHISFLALTDAIDWLRQSYCDCFVLGEVPDFIAINHGSEDSDIHTCSTAGSSVAQFLVPFPATRRRFHIASCVCEWAQ